MIHYGRPKTGIPVSPSPQSAAVQKAAGRVLALGGAMIAGFFLLMTVPQDRETTAAGGVPEGAVAVMSTAVHDRETLTIPDTAGEGSAGTGAEPFGYMDGEWNLWEYIGDLMWSLLS